jgi:hypothetical protein
MPRAGIMRTVFTLAAFCAPAFGQAGYLKRTVCTSGCDYTLSQLQTAVNWAAEYQMNTACVPIILELQAGQTFSRPGYPGLILPKKDPAACREFVRLRSSRLHEIPANQRATPADWEAGRLFRISHGGHQPAIATASNFTGTTPTGFWALEGLDLTKNAESHTYTIVSIGDVSSWTPPNVENTPEKTPRNVVIDRCLVRGSGDRDQRPRIGLSIHARHVIVKNSYVYRIQDQYADSSGIWANNFEDVRVENTLIDVASLNILTGGDDMRIPGWTNRHLTLIGNYFTKNNLYWYQQGGIDPTWPCLNAQLWKNSSTGQFFECEAGAWSATTAKTVFGSKAGVDIKNIQGMYAAGNHSENIFGFEWNLNQTGSAWLFNQTDVGGGAKSSGAFQVVLEYNYHKNTGDVFNWGQAGNSSGPWNGWWFRPHQHFTIRHNLSVEQNRPELVRASNGGMLANRAPLKPTGFPNDLNVYHNTLVLHPEYTGVVASIEYSNLTWDALHQRNGGNPQPDPWRLRRQHFRDNIISYGGGPDWQRGGFHSSFQGNTNGLCSMRHMGYYNPGELHLTGAWTAIGGKSLSTAVRTHATACNDLNRNTYPPGVVWDANLSNTFLNPSAGDYRVASGSVAKGTAAFGGDMGADVEAVLAASAYAKGGSGRSPWFDMAIRDIAVQPSEALIDVVKPTVGECNIVVAEDRTWAPAGTISQQASGRRVLATVTGLNPARPYFVKVECESGAYRRETSFMTTAAR